MDERLANELVGNGGGLFTPGSLDDCPVGYAAHLWRFARVLMVAGVHGRITQIRLENDVAAIDCAGSEAFKDFARLLANRLHGCCAVCGSDRVGDQCTTHPRYRLGTHAEFDAAFSGCHSASLIDQVSASSFDQGG